MTTVTWAQLTPDEQATLNYFCENGVPVGVHVSRLPACYGTLSNYGLMTFTQTAQAVMVDVTPAGIAVWQQGQVASAPPRSVWVAEHYEYNQGDSVLAIHSTAEGAKAHCEASTENVLTWYETELTDTKSYTGLCGKNGETFHVYEMRVLP